MVCPSCGYENRVASRRSCKRCHESLTIEPVAVPPGTFLPADMAPAGPFLPRRAPTIQGPDQALEALRSGTESERISARTYLADVFEQRGMIEEATELLEANARAGVSDPSLYTALISNYRRLGRHSDAEATMAHVALILTRQQPAPPLVQQTVAPPPAPVPHHPQPYTQPYYAPPQPYAPMPQQIVVNNNNVVTVGALNQSPPLILRLLYFLFIGWWFGPTWLLCALFLICLVITAPLGLYMLVKLPKAFFL